MRRRKLGEDIELDKLIGAFLDDNPSCERNGVLLHGAPLDVVQAEQLFAQERCRPTHAIHLDVPERVLDQRLGANVPFTHGDGADRTLQPVVSFIPLPDVDTTPSSCRRDAN